MALGMWPGARSAGAAVADRDDADALIPAEMFYTARNAKRVGEPAPKVWRDWLLALFPKHFFFALGKRHYEFWKWTLGIRAGERPRPFLGVWPRGSGKSTSAEVAVVALGARGHRKYCLYVRETQEQADKSVGNIAALLESSEMVRYYPEHAERKLGKHGNASGWRRNRLRTAGGFTVDALGLDTAARGLKVEEQRPDLIVFDDIDNKHDSPAATFKKIETITHSILPAGSRDVAVLGIQNLILDGGMFTQLVDGTADFLTDRIISGPYPAIDGLEYEWRKDPKTGVKRALITAGTATWEGQSLETCQDQINTIGLGAFLKECQHRVKDKGEGTVLRVTPEHSIDMDDDEKRELLAKGTGFAGVDFSDWRFAFVLFATDANRRAIRVDEYFSQRQGLSLRARKIHELCAYYGITGMMPLWADSANPQDIRELNEAFVRGWIAKDEDGKEHRVTSKLRAIGAIKGPRSRGVAVARMNNALDTNTLLFARDVTYDWRLGMNSGAEGTPMKGSRLLWEMEKWSYPKPRPGEAQDNDPDDDTADGADMIAATRYALMSHWKKVPMPIDHGHYDNDRAEPFDYAAGRFKEVPHAVDLLQEPLRRTVPRVNVPRPRTGR